MNAVILLHPTAMVESIAQKLQAQTGRTAVLCNSGRKIVLVKTPKFARAKPKPQKQAEDSWFINQRGPNDAA